MALSSTRAQAGALELCHYSCPNAEILLDSPLFPSTCWAPSTEATPVWNQTCLEAESAHTHRQTMADGQGPWGPLSRGNRDSRHLAWHCTVWGTLQEGFSGVGFLPQPEAVWNQLQCPSLAAWALRKMGGCRQASPFKGWGMTASKNFLMGSKPSSTCSLYLLN